MIRRFIRFLGELFYDLGTALLCWYWRGDARNAKPKPHADGTPRLTLSMDTPTVPWVPKRPSNDWRRWN